MTVTDDGRRRVLVVDDSFIMRRLVGEIVASDPDLAVCGQAENGKVALAMVRSQKPDVVLLDIEMPEMSGLETLRRLGLRSPSKVIVLSSLVADEDAAERREALRLGAFAAVGKPSGAVSLDLRQHRASEIVATIRRATGLPPIADLVVVPEPPSAAEAQGDADLARTLMDLIASAVLVFDRDGRLQRFNAQAERLLAPLSLTPGLPLEAIFNDFNAPIAERLGPTLRDPAVGLREDIDLATAAGEWIPLRIAVDPARVAGGRVVLMDDMTRERRMKALLDKTLSPSIADSMIAASDADLRGRTCEVTILFADLRDYTRLSESLGAAGIVALLNEYFSFMADIVRAHGGVIDKYIGDALMAVFGTPLRHGDDADRAVETARDMLRALDIVNEGRVAAGEMPLRIGIGLATGPVVAGAIGSPDRLNVTVIGDAVNLAARLESQTKTYGATILACGETMARLARPVSARLVDVVQVKGQDRATEVHEIGPRGEGAAAIAFARAFALYASGAFAAAGRAFAGIGQSDPGDVATARLVERCAGLEKTPPRDWTGTWRLTEK